MEWNGKLNRLLAVVCQRFLLSESHNTNAHDHIVSVSQEKWQSNCSFCCLKY